MVDQQLQHLQSKFEERRAKIHDREQIRIEFTNKFPIDKLDEVLTLKTYVVGKPDTFCYWVEHKTIDLGKMRINGARIALRDLAGNRSKNVACVS